MNNADLLTFMRAANDAVNPDGWFSYGRIEDVSLDFDKVPRDNPNAYLIYLLPFRGRDDAREGTTTYSVTVGFFKQDALDSVPSNDHILPENPGTLNREAIIAATETLMRQFVSFLSNNNGNTFTIPRWDFGPKYRDLQGTYTGHAVVFDIETKFDDCDYFVAPPEEEA